MVVGADSVYSVYIPTGHIQNTDFKSQGNIFSFVICVDGMPHPVKKLEKSKKCTRIKQK